MEDLYHPDFLGSFSQKRVLPALVPGLGYDDLAVADGGSASAILEGLLLGEGSLPSGVEKRLRRDLLRYCERDTLGMVKMYEALRGYADLSEGRDERL
jgi:hypothetical protein